MDTLESFIKDLKENIKGDILDDEYSLGMYATDASHYQIMPTVVVLPKDEADVKKLNDEIEVLEQEYKETASGSKQ